MTTSLYTAELLRPDDMLDLLVGVAGAFDLDTTGAEPLLRRTDTAQPAHLFILLGPQWIGEQAYYETDPVPTLGTTAVRISSFSRLVFEIPETVSEIPFTFAGLLDWSALRLVVSPLASWGSGIQSEGSPPPIIPPSIAETALELPYRLVMSPSPDAKWVHVDHPVTFAGRTELWHTRLAIGQGESAPLWAIWSPDFKIPIPTDLDDYGEFRSSSTKRERAELVALTVGFGLSLQSRHGSYATAPVQARRLVLSQLGAWLHWEGSWQPTEIIRGWFGGPGFGRKPAVPLTLGQIEAGPEPGVKQAVQAGGAAAAPARTLDSGAAIGVARAKATVADQFTRVLVERAGRLESAASLIGKVFPVAGPGDIDLVGWTHSGTGGRDQFVKIVELGQYCPFGHRATLTKVTERRFDPGGQAYLIQYEYSSCEQPLVSFAGTWETADGRKMPLEFVRLKTLITPHLLAPIDDTGVKPNQSKVYGPHGLIAGAQWIVDDDNNDVVFHAVGVDRHGREVPFSASLIFVPDSVFETDGNNVASAYNYAKDRRKCAVPRQLMTFAPPDPQAGDEDTALATEALFFESTVSGNTFTVTLNSAAVRVPAVSRLTGQDVPMNIKPYQDYLDKGIDVVNGVFAELAVPDDVVDILVSADQAGGFVTPNLAVKGLQRGAGPVAGTLSNAAQNQFVPDDFFPMSSPTVAKLFDSIPLGNLAVSGAGDTAPRLTTSLVHDSSGTPVATRTTLAWTPQVGPKVDPPKKPKERTVTEGPLKLTLNKSEKTTVLDIKAEVTTPRAQGATATTEVSGNLTNFQITLLKVVSVAFDHFTIDSHSGAKPVVDLKLADKMVFEGDLAFLNKLADLFDPAGLSDPPYVDVTPTGLVAGFGQALPPLPIGVLELHDLRLDAAFSLPFLSGRPQLNLAFSSREHPLVITVSALGGGGFLHLEFDTTGVVMIEGSLEFGGEFALDIGVASGGVHLMAGIYVRVDKSSTPEVSQLTGFVDLAGEVSVLGLVSLSVDFYLTLTYVENKATGRAELTVSISVTFFSTSVTMSVERSFGNGSGDPSAADVFPSYADWQSYAEAFA